MIPQQVLSTRAVPAPFLPPDDIERPDALTDYELGGIAIRDPSQGLQVQVWTFGYDGAHVWASAPAVVQTNLFTADDVTELSGAFDQNMNPAVAFVDGGVPKLWWFDSTVSAQVFTTFDAIQSPKVTLDDKRALEVLTGTGDVIFAYMRASVLYFRAQRDRYSVEYQLGTIPQDYIFVQMGMSTGNRLQFSFVPPEAPPI